MTAITANYPNSNPFLKLFFFAIILAVIAGAFGVTLNSHAVDRHGQDAVAIRRCLDNKFRPDIVFKNKSDAVWYLLCQLEDSRWGLQAVTKDGSEKTAFVPGDGSLRTVMDYLSKFATRWTKALPWLR